MKKKYSNTNVDICLIATGDVNQGIRSLSSFLKEQGYTVILGFFSSWGCYTTKERQSIQQWIRELNPKIIGFSTGEVSRARTVALISMLKEEHRPIIVGGHDPTLNPELYMMHADYVIRGEGEYACAELLDAVLHGRDARGILNLCYRNAEGGMVINPLRPLIQDLDSIPFEDWLDVEHHYELKEQAITKKENYLEHRVMSGEMKACFFIFTIRGCHFSCNFCTQIQIVYRLSHHKPPIAKRSIASVIRRVEQLINIGAADVVLFADNDFFLRTYAEIKEFAEAWKQKIHLPFMALCTPLTLDEAKLKELSSAGTWINMGIQSGSERINYALYGRKMGHSSIIKASRLLSQYGTGLLPPLYDVIINNPYETAEDLKQSISLFRQLSKPYFAGMYSLIFFQGTPLYEKAIHDGLLAGADPTAGYNWHNIMRHFDNLIRRGGHYYLNSLLYWMSGEHTHKRYGVVPGSWLDFLTKDSTIKFFNTHSWLVTLLNRMVLRLK